MISDWSERPISALIARLDSGASVNSENRQIRPGEIGVLKVSAVSFSRFDPTAHKAVVSQSERERLSVTPRANTVLVSRANTYDLVGASVYVDKDYPDLFLSDKVWRITTQPDYAAKWLNYVLSTDEVRQRIVHRASGTSASMKNISQEAFLAIRVQVPPANEQHKIAAILGTWDDAIALTERRIAAGQQRKQGLMQRLLTGRARFSEFSCSKNVTETPYGDLPADWQYVSIAQIATEIGVRNTEGRDYPVLSCTKHYGLVDSLEYFGRQMFSDDTSTYKVVKRGQFAYATNHIEEGSIGYQNLHDVALISPMYTVFETGDQVDDLFLYRVLKTEKYRRIFETSTNGTVNRRGSLRWKEFSQIKVPLPSLSEQCRIAEVLAACDRELDLLARKRDALQRQKRGLMQQLLTGRVRVGGLDHGGAK